MQEKTKKPTSVISEQDRVFLNSVNLERESVKNPLWLLYSKHFPNEERPQQMEQWKEVLTKLKDL